MFEILNKILVKEGYYREIFEDDDWDDPDRIAPTQETFYYDREFQCDEGVRHESASFSTDIEKKNVLSFSVDAGIYLHKYKTFGFEDYQMSHEEFNKAAEATLRYFFSNWNKCYQDWDNFNLITA